MDKVNNRKLIVKSFGHLLMYSSSGTRGVSLVILSGEHHIGQEITVGNGKVDKETIKAG
jgi:hypothetical protein